jgi:pimeloyl-ACP methyl ester carboxylesterase
MAHASAPSPTTAADQSLRLTDGTIAFALNGRGPLVVMVPGLGDLKEEYRFLAERIVSAGYRVATMDLRGHGNSSVGWPDYSNAALGSDVVALIRHISSGPAAVIGTSMGAGAAAWAAAESPSDIRSLVLIGPFVRQVPIPWWKSALFKTVFQTAFRGPWGPVLWSKYYAALYPTAKPADFEAYTARLVENLRESGRMAALQAMLAAPKRDVESRLGEIASPTLIVMGSKDPDFDDPAEEAEFIARTLKGKAVMIGGAGHYPHAEMPDATAPAILSFLAETTGTKG